MPEAVFVGGGTGGGTTTVARVLAAEHGLRLLQIDHFWYAHSERAGETPPTPDLQWLEWTPVTQAADFERLSRLMLGFVLEDLAKLPDQPFDGGRTTTCFAMSARGLTLATIPTRREWRSRWRASAGAADAQRSFR